MRNLHPHTHPWATTEDRTHTIPQHTWLRGRASRLLNSMRIPGTFMVTLTSILIAVSLSFSLTALYHARTPPGPELVEQAKKDYAAGDPHAALMHLRDYADSLDARLLEVPDALIQDQLAVLWHRMRAGSYTETPDGMFPEYLRESARQVLHPQALMLAGELLAADRGVVLEAHARALKAGEEATPDWHTLEHSSNYLPRMLLAVAIQEDDRLRAAARSMLAQALDTALVETPAELAAVLRPHFNGLHLAAGTTAAEAWLDRLAGDDGETAIIETLARPALFALDALEPDVAEMRADALERFACSTYTHAFRAETVRLLEAPLPEERRRL